MSPRRILSAGVAVLLTLAFAHAQSGPELFVDPGGERGAGDVARKIARLKEDLAAEDVRIAAIALPLLTVPGTPIVFNLPGASLSVTGAIESRTGKAYTWFGKVAGDKLSSVVLVVGEGGVRGAVQARAGQFRIAPLGDGTHAIVRVDEARLPADESHGDEPREEKRATWKSWLWPWKPAVAVASNPPRTYTLGVLFAYTGEVEEAVADIEGDIALAAELANVSFKNSEIGIRLKVAGIYETSYRQTGRAHAEIDMDEVLGRRQRYGADIAVLVISDLYRTRDERRRSLCGTSRRVGAGFEDAFIVVKASCLGARPHLAHEIGHILGARHNWEKDRRRRPCGRYGHGLYSITGRWRDIMSYRCPAGAKVCPRILFWSNPRIRDDNGIPMGDPEFADNARCLNERIQTFCSGAAPCATPDGA
jgi:hypothetical protein